MNSNTKKPFNLTANDIMSLKPCYNKSRVAALCQQASIDGPEKVLLSLPAVDARWIISRLLNLDDRLQWAKACAERARGYADAVKASASASASAFANAAAFAAEYTDASDAADAAECAAAAFAAAFVVEDAVCDTAAKEHQTAIRHALSLLGY